MSDVFITMPIILYEILFLLYKYCIMLVCLVFWLLNVIFIVNKLLATHFTTVIMHEHIIFRFLLADIYVTVV